MLKKVQSEQEVLDKKMINLLSHEAKFAVPLIPKIG